MTVQFLAAVLSQDKAKGHLSSEHFSVDRTLLARGLGEPEELSPEESALGLRPEGRLGPPRPGRNGGRDFHGERRRNDNTHASTTDPTPVSSAKACAAKAGGPGKEARLCFMAMR
jgi:hypothetical protein